MVINNNLSALIFNGVLSSIRIEYRNMEDSTILNTTTYLEALAQGNGLSEIEVLILQGLELIHVGKGIIRCKLLVTDRVAGDDGTWRAGAITAVMDAIGAASVYSTGDGLHSSVDLNASFYSAAKIHEKVEVEARVKGTNGRLKSSVIEIRRERDGELIATGRLWMAPLVLKAKHTGSSNLRYVAFEKWPITINLVVVHTSRR
ncbi:PREDICTED: uncharacterized protein LOC106316380 isoform X4 [Brassica oleracea var. oleracea]|uniref:uncharacterized protein LOC106316380 isoform X4 n=1 Tax=Brassica oleracea var. oleracea TaxID=109376 RepID=UPI0006A6BE9C|nr:PREDICTED: uncharacterized protein LOC106316380 isoform X4 [Brassica oleracea var. oleracea]